MLTWFNDFIEKSNLIVNNTKILQLLYKTDEKGKLALSADEASKINREITHNATAISNQQIENSRKLLLLIEDVAEPSKKALQNRDKRQEDTKNQ